MPATPQETAEVTGPQDTGPQDTVPPANRPVGRPRDPRVALRVLAATRQLLGELGYAHLTIDAVARLAGVGRPTIYRRWPSKAELVHEAAFGAAGAAGFAPTGNFRRDLRGWVTTTADLFCDPVGQAAITGLLGELRERPELRDAFRSGLERTSRSQLDETMRMAVDRGEIRPDIDAEALFDTLAGAVLFWALVDGGSDQAQFERRLAGLLDAALEPRSRQDEP